MMRDLSAVEEEWAEAAEWLEHFVTDHTDSQRVHRQLNTTLHYVQLNGFCPECVSM